MYNKALSHSLQCGEVGTGHHEANKIIQAPSPGNDGEGAGSGLEKRNEKEALEEILGMGAGMGLAAR